MDATFVQSVLSESVVHPLCWTLIHSLWIGGLAAGLAGGVIITTQKSPSRLRYQGLCLTLLAFVIAIGFVVYQQASTSFLRSGTGTVPVLAGDVETTFSPAAHAVYTGYPAIAWLVSFINQESDLICAIWLVFFSLRSLKLIRDFYSVHRIRYRGLHPVSDGWANRLSSFKHVLGIDQTIRLFQSEFVHIPATVGFFKPVILLPLGLICQLPPEQIETILWHELAHVYRRDYLVNLLQSLVETAFFFNPGVLWLSALIRQEREVCCDDIVLAHTVRKSQYAQALLAFQEPMSRRSESTMILGLGSHPLVYRLRRLITGENKRLSGIEKIALPVGLMLILGFAMIPSPRLEGIKQTIPSKKNVSGVALRLIAPSEKRHLPPAQPVTRPTKVTNDTMPVQQPVPVLPEQIERQFLSSRFVKSNEDWANREMVVRDVKDTEYHLKIVDYQLTALSINGVSVPDPGLPQYQNLLRQIDEWITRKQQLKRAFMAATIQRAQAERQQQLQEWNEARQRKQDYLRGERKTEQPTSQLPHEVGGQKFALTEKSKPEMPMPGSKKKPVAGTVADKIADRQPQNQKEIPPSPDISEAQERVRGVISVLVRQQVVADPTAVEWFGLSEDELLVNGVRQPANLHQELKSKYGIRPHFGLYYGPVQMSGAGVHLDKSDI